MLKRLGDEMVRPHCSKCPVVTQLDGNWKKITETGISLIINNSIVT